MVGEAEGAEAEGEVGAHHAEAGAEVASESAAEELEVEGAVDAEDSAEAAGLGVEEEEGEGEDLVVVGEGDLEVGDESLQFIVLWTEKSFVTKMLQIVPVPTILYLIISCVQRSVFLYEITSCFWYVIKVLLVRICSHFTIFG